MSDSITASIVAVLDSDDNIAGTGFILSEDMVLTCAHVVESAQSAPGKDIRIRHHLNRRLQIAKVSTKMWRPSDGDDIAVLELSESLPVGTRFLFLGSSIDCDGHRFRTFGYPDLGTVEGVTAEGTIVGRTHDLAGKVLLEIDSSRIRKGHSGAPVLDKETDKVIGMVKAVYHPDQTTKMRDAALAIPYETIISIFPRNEEMTMTKPTVSFITTLHSSDDIHKEFQKVKSYARDFINDWNDSSADSAFEIAYTGHQKQKRISGEPFIFHPLAVAKIAAEQRCDMSVFIAALLHDVAEDTEMDLEKLGQKFGKDLARVIDSVTHISRTEGDIGKDAADQETLRKTFVGIAKEPKVAYIKLSDRLHNLMTLGARPVEKWKRTLEETRKYYIPLARELGLRQIQRELEQHLLVLEDPKLYDDLELRSVTDENKYTQDMRMIQREIDDLLRGENAGLNNIFNFDRFRFMQMPIKSFALQKSEQLASLRLHPHLVDKFVRLFKIVLVFATKRECYAALGVIHTKWKSVSTRFEDSISNTPDNGYETLRTLVSSGDDLILDIHLQTAEMVRISELGPLQYAQNSNDSNALYKLPILQKIVKLDSEVENTAHFLDYLLLDILPPKIRILLLPHKFVDIPFGASILDLSYYERIGASCSGALVNNTVVDVDYLLADGDIVGVFANRNEKAPSTSWEYGKTYFTATTKYSIARGF